MPAYGHGFTLSSPSTATGIGAPASGPCSAGTYTREAGFLAYYEVKMAFQHNLGNSVRNSSTILTHSVRLCKCMNDQLMLMTFHIYIAATALCDVSFFSMVIGIHYV
jgi:hypothetical protein